jgi:serine/threonine protein phosphatase PrpC
MKLTVGVKTDTGMLRSNNEDFWFADAERGLYIVADGMGGHQAGEVASHLAVETIQSSLKNRADPLTGADLKEAIERANARVLEESLKDPNKHGMGTTAVVLVITNDDHILLGHVGDSRAYALTSHGLKQLTEDHSVVFQLVKEGKITETEARFHPGRGALLRSLGVHKDVEVDIAESQFAFQSFLLCTDGLTEMLTDDEIEQILRDKPDPQQACETLVRRANDAGGRDNVTVLLVKREE